MHLKDLLKCAQDLEDIAYSTPTRNRVHGSEGHLNTVKYFAKTLESLGKYYTVELQDFTTEVTLASARSFSAASVEYDTESIRIRQQWHMDRLTNLLHFCLVRGVNFHKRQNEDVPDTVSGKVALIARGNCTFIQKITNAGAKGAVAAIIYNNADAGIASGTLGRVHDLIPVGSLTRADGLALAERTASGETVTSSATYWAYVTSATSQNVIATSKFGDPNNVLFLGVHSDSDNRGPGINDNGSGSCGILTVAKALSKRQTNN
ncbi:hypothetical protein F5Y19DRAFT_477771 [Xylariaceae sp. FL1651]|nr:hypothetical protein F5Y19DRAFT_477771 [Xylariaceae sp. FL1651]